MLDQIAESKLELKNRIMELEKANQDSHNDYLNLYNRYNTLLKELEALREENKKLKAQTKENGIEELKDTYEKKIRKMQSALVELEGKVNLQSRVRQITDEQVQEIKSLLEQGLSYRQIEEQTKWSTFTISRINNGYYDE